TPVAEKAAPTTSHSDVSLLRSADDGISGVLRGRQTWTGNDQYQKQQSRAGLARIRCRRRVSPGLRRPDVAGDRGKLVSGRAQFGPAGGGAGSGGLCHLGGSHRYAGAPSPYEFRPVPVTP